jgi:hypothetical protein
MDPHPFYADLMQIQAPPNHDSATFQPVFWITSNVIGSGSSLKSQCGSGSSEDFNPNPDLGSFRRIYTTYYYYEVP